VSSLFHDQLVARSVTIVVEADLRLVLVEHHEIVEHAHHRHLGNEGRRLEDRHVGRADRAREPQDAAALLRPGQMAAESANSSEPAARQLKYCFTRLSSLCSWLGRRRLIRSRVGAAAPKDENAAV